jgi:hypothetical protein
VKLRKTGKTLKGIFFKGSKVENLLMLELNFRVSHQNVTNMTKLFPEKWF